jgi:hypothetical protein
LCSFLHHQITFVTTFLDDSHTFILHFCHRLEQEIKTHTHKTRGNIIHFYLNCDLEFLWQIRPSPVEGVFWFCRVIWNISSCITNLLSATVRRRSLYQQSLEHKVLQHEGTLSSEYMDSITHQDVRIFVPAAKIEAEALCCNYLSLLHYKGISPLKHIPPALAVKEPQFCLQGVCICMYVCVYVSMYVYMYLCMSVCMYVCVSYYSHN